MTEDVATDAAAEERAPETVDELLRTIDKAWNGLNGAIAQLTEEQMTIPTDHAGWTVKDHLAHLAAWENSVLVILRDRKPQYEGLGVDKVTWDADDLDATNEVVRQANADAPLDEVRTHSETVHAQVVETISELTDEELRLPVDHWVASGGDFPIVDKIAGNSSEHYREHREWMLAIVA
jgi:hypothetical protein